MDAQRRAVAHRAIERNLELARQERELRVQRRPLADDLGIDARVLDLVRRDTGVLVGGDVANAVAARLDGVHLDFRQFLKNIRRFGEAWPIELNVLPRREMPVSLIVAPGDMGEPAELHRRQHAIGHGDAQHVGV